MPLAELQEAGIVIGLGSDVSGGPDPSMFSVMRAGAYAQMARRALVRAEGATGATVPLGPLDWLRLGSLEGARALGLGERIGSVEAGKEADLVVVDPTLTSPLSESESPVPDSADGLASRLIFRAHPGMVRGAWVRGRRLAGPGGAT
jgi:cytosine/adenosine deaminase-related metal-dependent hydrolase